jgi:hypothetical protein
VDLPSDFNTLLNTVRKGMRGVSDPTAIGCYADLNDPHAEYSRKVRTVSRGLRSLGRNLYLLNPIRNGLSAWELFSHKLCRWLVPFALAGALVSSLALAPSSSIFAVFAAAQVLCYSLAGYVMSTDRRVAGIWKIVPFFVLVNVSILHAWFNAVRGHGAVIWEPSRR